MIYPERYSKEQDKIEALEKLEKVYMVKEMFEELVQIYDKRNALEKELQKSK